MLVLRILAAIENILVPRGLAVLAVPTDEVLAILAVPAVQNPEILQVRGVSRAGSNPEMLRVQKFPQVVLNLEILRVLAVSAVHGPEILRVHEVPAGVYLENISLYLRGYWEHL